ncbi:MAG TPA: hypothetical protein DCE42_04555 [Myxococcales bacterium]|nr:hypothetical protein [Deltaproteobacteria bacterium]HAA53999.1 hypothetical protein [Myxococcales bacterium]|tara:strand:+ start:2175 stop:3194 length:1020 start_codon:yes stop_codon:yes gene_type:complete
MDDTSLFQQLRIAVYEYGKLSKSIKRLYIQDLLESCKDPVTRQNAVEYTIRHFSADPNRRPLILQQDRYRRWLQKMPELAKLGQIGELRISPEYFIDLLHAANAPCEQLSLLHIESPYNEKHHLSSWYEDDRLLTLKGPNHLVLEELIKHQKHLELCLDHPWWSSLKGLHLHSCPIESKGMRALFVSPHMEHIRALTLKHCELKRPLATNLVHALGPLPLAYLDLSDNALHPQFVERFHAELFDNLTYLLVQNTGLNRGTFLQLCDGPGLRKLKVLDVTGNYFAPEFATQLPSKHSLQHLTRLHLPPTLEEHHQEVQRAFPNTNILYTPSHIRLSKLDL